MADESKLAVDIQVDEPVVLDANFRGGPLAAHDRRKVDNQILAIQRHLVDALLRAKLGTYFMVSQTSADIVEGDLLCSASEGDVDGFHIVKHANATALSNAKAVKAIALVAAKRGTLVFGALPGSTIPAEITGLAEVSGVVRCNTSSGRCERLAGAFDSTDYPVGVADTKGAITFLGGAQGVLMGAVGGGGGGGSTQITVGDRGTLAAVSILAGMTEGTRAAVQSVRGDFRLSYASGLVANGNDIIAASDGLGFWVFVPESSDPSWLDVSDWTIRPSSGDDDNLGTSGAPLKTHRELMRRIGRRAFKRNTKIRIPEGLPYEDPVDIEALIPHDVVVEYIATPSTVRTGTLSAVTAQNPASNTRNILTDGVVNWTADAAKNRRVVITNAPAVTDYEAPCSFIESAPTSTQARTLSFNRVLTDAAGVALAPYAISNGLTYRVEELPVVHVARLACADILGGISEAEITRTTASFSMPAVGSTVQIPVGSTANIKSGYDYYVARAGVLHVESVDSSTLLTLRNRGEAGNVNAATTIATNAVVSIAANDFPVVAFRNARLKGAGSVDTIFVRQGAILIVKNCIVDGYFSAAEYGSLGIYSQNSYFVGSIQAIAGTMSCEGGGASDVIIYGGDVQCDADFMAKSISCKGGRLSVGQAAIFDAVGDGLNVGYDANFDIDNPGAASVECGFSYYGTPRLWGNGNAGAGVHARAACTIGASTSAQLTITGVDGDAKLAGSTTARAFNPAVNGPTQPRALSWANIVAAVGSGGFGGAAHSYQSDAHIVIGVPSDTAATFTNGHILKIVGGVPTFAAQDNLGGDTTGAPGANTVVKVNGAPVPTIGSAYQSLQVNAAGNALVYGLVSLTNGVTGTLPVGNLPNLAGHVTGALNSTVVTTVPFAVIQAALAAASSAIGVNNKNISSLADPVNAQDAATKAYVDAVANGLSVKFSVLVAATSNVSSLSGLATTIDGIGVSADGTRVLLTAQTTASQNGIWVAHAGAWTRPADFATAAHAAGSFVFVEEGTLNGSSGWVCATIAPNDVIGTNSLAFTQFSGAGEILPGAGLAKSGNTLSVANLGITNAMLAGGIDLASKVTGVLPRANQQAQNVGGDLSGTTASATVNRASGSAPFDFFPSILRWDSATSTPTITQLPSVGDATFFFFQPQSSSAGAGGDGVFRIAQGATVNGKFYFQDTAANTLLEMAGDALRLGVPLKGDTSRSSPHSLSGFVAINITADTTLTAAQFANRNIRLNVTLNQGTTYTVTFPNNAGYDKNVVVFVTSVSGGSPGGGGLRAKASGGATSITLASHGVDGESQYWGNVVMCDGAELWKASQTNLARS